MDLRNATVDWFSGHIIAKSSRPRRGNKEYFRGQVYREPYCRY